MKSVNEMMGVGAVAGIGAAPSGSDPSSAEAKKFAEPGVPAKKKKRVVKATLKRFSEWVNDNG